MAERQVPHILDPRWPSTLRDAMTSVYEALASLEARQLSVDGGTITGDVLLRGLLQLSIDAEPRGIIIRRYCDTDWADGMAAVACSAHNGWVSLSTTGGDTRIVGVFAGGGFADSEAEILTLGYHPRARFDAGAVTMGQRVGASTTLGLLAGLAAPAAGGVIGKALEAKGAGAAAQLPMLVGV